MFKNLFKKEKVSRQSLKSRNNELIVKHNPKSPVSEAYRNIRTNLNFTSPDKPLKTIAVTSSAAAEGKSLTLVNLALSMAQNGKKVIIIDGDLRKPMQHKFFEMTNFNGLSGILTGEIEFGEGLRETNTENIKLISTGVIPPNPAELLNSHRMEEILAKAGEQADIVFVDTPPVVAVTDAAVLGNKVDGTIIVIASHQTDQRMLLKAQDNLERARANIIGVVLNKYPAYNDRNYQYYYYGQTTRG